MRSKYFRSCSMLYLGRSLASMAICVWGRLELAAAAAIVILPCAK